MSSTILKKKRVTHWHFRCCSLIISSFYKPETVIETLLPYLSGSRPVVVYSHTKEVLVGGAQYMRRSKDFIEADITESFLRQYQVRR